MKNNYKSPTGVNLLIRTLLWALFLFPISAFATSPVVTALSPLNNATNVNVDGVFSMNFDQNIYTGLAGKRIRLIDVATENILYSAEISSDQISIVGAVISWTLPDGVVDYSKNYYINMEPTAVKNGGGQYFSGMSYASWKITTKADNDAPVFSPSSSRPADGVVGYYLKSSFVELVFDEAVQAGTGNITIKRTDNDAVVINVDVTNSSDISINQESGSNRFTVIPTDVLDYGTSYYLEVDNGAITDLLGNAFAGIGPNDLTFTMQDYVDTEAPVISSFLPADNVTDVAIDTDLSIVFDEDVQKGTGSIFIKNASGGAIVHTIALSSVTITDNTASFSLPADLSLSTGYFITMVAGVFEDTSGNAFAGFTNSTTWSFTTGSGVDTTPPTVTSLFPLNGATEVSTGNIDILFDYFIQKGTGTIYLKDAVTDAVVNSVNVASADVDVLDGSYHLRMDDFINYTLTNREFYIEMEPGVIQDLAGNDFAGLSKGDWQFKTQDTNTPVVINSSPATRSKGVALDATITFTANEPLLQPSGGFVIYKLLVEEALNPIAFFSVVPGVPRTGVHYVPAEDITVIGNTVSFDLPGSGIMEEGAMYYISSSGGIIDLVGNESIGIYPSSSYLFKTFSSDVTGPVVTATDPVDNAIDVPYLPSLSITFDEPIVKTNGLILVHRASDNGVDRGISILSPEVVISGNTMTITPNTTFQPNTEYYIQLGNTIADYQGNLTTGISGTDFSFTTIDPGDVTSPTVVSLFPTDNATAVPVGSEFTILYNEEVKLSGGGAIYFRRVSDNSVLTTIDVLSDEVSIVGNSLTINPSTDIAPNTEFYIQGVGSAVQDASDNYAPGYSFEDYSWSFTTAPDVTPPNLLSTYPAYGDIEIPIDANYTMQFDEPVSRYTLAFLYSASDDEFIQYFFGTEIVLSDENKTVTINPVNDLLPGKEYYIKVTATAFRDASSNFFAGIQDGYWSFTTAGVDNSDNDAPVVQSFNPAHLSTTFATAPKLSITFDEPIAAGTGNLRLKDKSNDNILAVVSINSATISDATILFDPGVDLPKDGNSYYVIIDNGAITDLAGNAFGGIANNTTWNFSTDDNALPFIITKSPADGNGEVANSGAIFDLTFNENIAAGTGSLSIYNYDNNQLVEEFEMGVSAFYSISNATITLNSQITFDPNTHYYIKVDNGAIEDTSGNLFGGMFGKDAWDFTTFGEDVAPLLSGSFSPIDDATSVGVSDNLVITFNEDVQASANGYVFLKYAAGTTREAISLNSASAVFSGNTLTINPANDLINGVDFYISIPAGAITDLAGNDFAGISDATTWNFTAELVADVTAPFVTTITPYDDQTHIAIDSDLTLYFSENVQKGSGNILIKDFGTDATVQTIDVTSGEVSIAGQLVTINPASDLSNLTEYYIEMASGVFQDMAGNEFAGYAKPDWSFTTIVLADIISPSIASLSPVDGATNLNALENFTITFDEPIKKGSGFLQIYDDGDVLIQNINSALSANVTFDEYSVTINPTNALAYGKTYYIVIGSGIIKDLSNNAFSLAKGEWDFSTSATDTHNPNLVTLQPTTDYIDWPRTGSNMFMTFDEIMVAGTGNVYVKRVDNDAIAITKAAGDLFNLGFINPWFQTGYNTLDYGTEYYVEIASGVLTDAAGNPFAGISKGTWHITIEEDVTPPMALSQGPSNNTTGYGIINNIIVFFNEPVQLGVGAIILRDAVSGEVLKTYDESSPEVTISGGTGLHIDPASPYLQYETQYSVEIGGNVIQDLSGNPFAGIAEGDWLFTTADKQTQTINFTSMPPRIYGGADFGLIATATSSLAITYEVVEGPISIDGTTVTILGAGDVTIRATQTGDDEYQAAVSVEQSFEVTQKSQSISFGSQPSKTFGVAPFALTATVASGLEIEFSVVSGSAILSGNDVIITGVGSIIIAANQPGNENFAAANEVQRSITVNKAAQTITFDALADKSFNDADFELDATSNSGLEVTYTLIGGPATISGNTVSITGLGTVGIRASQVGNVNYNATGSVDQFFEVTKADQTISFSAIANKTYGDADFDLSATASSTLAVSYSSSDVSVATISGNTVSIIGAGSTVITASQAGNVNNNVAPTVDQALTVTKADQTISITAIANKVITDADFDVTATTNSGLSLTYSVAGPATNSGNTISLTGGSGTVDVTVDQAGNSNYNAAQATTSFNVIDNSKQDQTITFNTISDKVFGVVPFALSATASSALAVSFAVVSGNATISGEMVTITGVGLVIIKATQPGDGAFNPAPEAQQTFEVAKVDQTISITLIEDKLISDPTFDVIATTTSGLALTYSVEGPASILGTTITLDGTEGIVTVTVSQAGNANFNAATAETSFNVTATAKEDQTITITAIADKLTTDPNFEVVASTTSNLALAYSVTGPATIAGTTISLDGTEGFVTVTVSQAGNANFNAATAETSFNVTATAKEDQTITITEIADKLTTDTDFEVVASTTSNLVLTYNVTGPATIAGTTISLDGTEGLVTVTVSQAGDANFNAATAETSFNVTATTKEDQTITITAIADKLTTDTDFEVVASTTSNLALAYSVTGPATIAGTTISLDGSEGFVTVTVSQAGDVNFNAATAETSFNVTATTKEDQTITITEISDKLTTDADFEVVASTTSTLSLTYSVTGPATIMGTTISLDGTEGLVTVTVSQAGDVNFNTATAETTFNVAAPAKTDQVITLTAIADKLITDADFDVVASTTSGLALTYSVAGPATITGTTITLEGTEGLVTVTVSQAGDDSFNAATAETTFNVAAPAKTDQVITFNTIEDQLLEASSVMLGATSDSELEISYEITSGNATITGNIISFTELGFITVTASQAGDNAFNAATPVEQTFEVVTVTGFDLEIANQIQVYPNPAANYIQISDAYNEIKIVSANGVVVYQSADGRNQIDISNLNSGSYVVMISTKSGTQTIKLLKK